MLRREGGGGHCRDPAGELMGQDGDASPLGEAHSQTSWTGSRCVAVCLVGGGKASQRLVLLLLCVDRGDTSVLMHAHYHLPYKDSQTCVGGGGIKEVLACVVRVCG